MDGIQKEIYRGAMLLMAELLEKGQVKAGGDVADWTEWCVKKSARVMYETLELGKK